ncbi:MAG: hydroxymethylglutaryl-CoA reductase, degradative [Gammaproteobacteria bacterium]|nr:hydroxymethylglutaryl-CoA reductase, degradative [Gammaproteobacteria bacterium]
MLNEKAREGFEGFSKLKRAERFERLIAMGALTHEDVAYLSKGGVQALDLGENLIENVIGYFQLPLGVATNFCIDGTDYVIPMAVEETSIIAALSKTAKWIRKEGSITTEVLGDAILGQINIPKVDNFDHLSTMFHEHRAALIKEVNQEVAASMVARGGGVTDMILRRLERPEGGDMAVIHLSMNSCDAMGANIINQVLEYLKNPIEMLTGETVGVCILSNLNDQKLARARVILNNVDEDLGERLQEVSLFAEIDPYRAATHNKGVMNGIDPILIATGNDWRAVEAGVHAYAARSGRYQAISTWRYKEGVLTGELTAPLVAGTVGGVTALHPTARMCLNMMDITSAAHLSRVLAAVGLVQNLGAINAMCTEGIIQGHMKLHIDNLLLVAGANDAELPVLKKRLKHWLTVHRRVGLKQARELLAELRHTPQVVPDTQ